MKLVLGLIVGAISFAVAWVASQHLFAYLFAPHH